jgi:hypothetical protein
MLMFRQGRRGGKLLRQVLSYNVDFNPGLFLYCPSSIPRLFLFFEVLYTYNEYRFSFWHCLGRLEMNVRAMIDISSLIAQRR